MTVRREIAELRRETYARSREDPSVLVQYGEGPRGEPAGRQVRRHRACEVERPLNAPGAKTLCRNEF